MFHIVMSWQKVKSNVSHCNVVAKSEIERVRDCCLTPTHVMARTI